MEFGPIWRALQRSKTSYTLIALQIAVTMAIMVNAISIIQERSQLMVRPSGVNESDIFYLENVGFAPDMDYRAMIEEDLRAIRGFPGVANAMMSNSVPLHGGGWSQGLQVEAGEEFEDTGVAIYFGDEQGIDTFELDLVAGRNFQASEIMWYDPEGPPWPNIGIMTRAMVNELFPDEKPEDIVGRTVYIDSNLPLQIIGVLDRMQAPWKSWTGVERSLLVPMLRGLENARYVIRAEPGRRDEVIPKIEKMLGESNKERIIRNVQTMADVRQRSYLEDAAMIKLLVFIVSLLTAITCLGIVGLASFSVARRTRQIGTRRALGASQPAILRYFMLENFLISSVGVAGGAVLAIGLNIWMVKMFELTPVDWYMIPAAMMTLWVVGQVAVFGPARRASKVPPAVATRAV